MGHTQVDKGMVTYNRYSREEHLRWRGSGPLVIREDVRPGTDNSDINPRVLPKQVLQVLSYDHPLHPSALKQEIAGEK